MCQMTFSTADLCDANPDVVQVADPVLRAFGGTPAFCGGVATVRVFEDNVLVRAALGEPGKGRVLVVDGGGSLRCALLGDNVAALAHSSGWAGIVVHGCIRDSVAISTIPIGIRALATSPRKSDKRGEGKRDVVVSFAGVAFEPGAYVYADEDGLIVAPRVLGA